MAFNKDHGTSTAPTSEDLSVCSELEAEPLTPELSTNTSSQDTSSASMTNDICDTLSTLDHRVSALIHKFNQLNQVSDPETKHGSEDLDGEFDKLPSTFEEGGEDHEDDLTSFAIVDNPHGTATKLSPSHSIKSLPEDDEDVSGSEFGNDKDDSQLCFVENNLYSILPISGKGLGMVANTRISRGSCVLTDSPIIRLNRQGELYQPPEAQFEDLSDHDQWRVLTLHNFHKRLGALKGVICTNAIPLREKAPESGLFVEASRINHACSPNTIHAWDEKAGKLNTYATRDIEEGEEITNSYIHGLADFATRQKHLRKHFGFTCQCQLCSLPVNERIRSDGRISKIHELKKRIYQLNTVSRVVPALKYTRELLDLYDEEGIVDDHASRAYSLAEIITDEDGDWLRFAVFSSRRRALESELKLPKAKINLNLSIMTMHRWDWETWWEKFGNRGRLRPESRGKEYEDWLFREDDWLKMKDRFPSIHDWEDEGGVDVDASGDDDWEVV